MPLSVLLLAYPGFNTLDLNGPLEVLMNTSLVSLEPPPFKVTIATPHEETKAAENITIMRHISLKEAKTTIEDYDVLIVPGAPMWAIALRLGLDGKPRSVDGTEMLEVVAAFAALESKDRDGGLRVIMSVCTGAIFLGLAGVFTGMKATTHFMALNALRDVCEAYRRSSGGAAEAAIVPEGNGMEARGKVRYVDAGLNENGVQVISSGGVSCGLDAALYLVHLKLGTEKALGVAGMMEYAWREEK